MEITCKVLKQRNLPQKESLDAGKLLSSISLQATTLQIRHKIEVATEIVVSLSNPIAGADLERSVSFSSLYSLSSLSLPFSPRGNSVNLVGVQTLLLSLVSMGKSCDFDYKQIP